MIFLGAGASAPFRIPTSDRLTNDITDLLKKTKKELLIDINTFFENWKKRNANFEEILTILRAYTNPIDIRNDNFSHIFASQHPKYQTDYSEIISKMHEMICDVCTSPFIQSSENYVELEELENIFSMTYDVLLGIPRMVNAPHHIIFSTNYDPSLEIWCQKRNIECIDGTKRHSNPEVKNVTSGEEHIQALTTLLGNDILPNIGLVRLHGSVWTYETQQQSITGTIKFSTPIDRRFYSDLYEQLKLERPIQILPGEEDRLSRGKWDIMYQYFKSQLQGRCLFIGYSFRHEVINAPILDNLRNGRITSLGILAPDPHQLVLNLFGNEQYPKNIIQEMPAKFGDSKGSSELGIKWLPRATRGRSFNLSTIQRDVKTWKNARTLSYLKMPQLQ